MDKEYLSNILARYYNRLNQVGYISCNQTGSILTLLFIDEYMLPYANTPKDKGIINKAISCLKGSCIMPYSSCN